MARPSVIDEFEGVCRILRMDSKRDTVTSSQLKSELLMIVAEPRDEVLDVWADLQ